MNQDPNLQAALRYKGWKCRPTVVTVAAERVRAFCEAIGEDDSRWGDCVPPTFPIVFREGQRPEITGLAGARLHGAQEFEYERPVRVGERLVLQTHVTDVFGKQGSDGRPLTFVLYETAATTEEGELVYRVRATQIVR